MAPSEAKMTVEEGYPQGGPSRLHRSISRQRSPARTSSPKRRGRSPSRKRRSTSRQRGRTRSIAAQRLEIPVPLEGVLQYKLRSKRSLVGTSSSSISQ